MVYDEDDWAVFWCSLLAPILLEEVTAGERRRYLQHLSQQEVTLPNGHRKQLSYSTLRRKVRRFRQQKIAGLRRRRRADRGQARKQRQQLIARAVELKRQQPRRSPRKINKFLAQEFGRTIPASTLNRFPAAGLGQSWRQPAIVCRQRENLPCARSTAGLYPPEHRTDAGSSG